MPRPGEVKQVVDQPQRTGGGAGDVAQHGKVIARQAGHFQHLSAQADGGQRIAQVAELAQAYPQATLVHRPGGGRACAADPDRLAQVVGNLVSNAVAYGAPGEPVEVASVAHPDGFTVSVRNAGDPIPESRLAALFQPMVRGTDTGPGSRSVGLGLYIVAEIVRAHGGTVTVSSTAGQGTEFVARFPAPQP